MRALILCILFITYSTYAAESIKGGTNPPQSTQNPCSNPCTDKQFTSVPPITINVSPSQTLGGSATDKSREKQNEPEWERWTGIGTIFLAVFTLCLAAVALWQRFDLKDASQKELRAYLGIPEPGVQRLGVVNHFQVQVTITNTGHTPARDVQKWMRCRLVNAGDNISFDRGNFDLAKRSIAPDSKWNLREDFTDWTDGDLNEIRHFRKTLYVWGETTYKDIYGKRHTTEFRLRSHATRLEIRLETLEGGGVKQHQIINGFDLEPDAEGNDLT